MYQEQVLSQKHPDEPLDEGRFVFECILAGTSKPLPCVDLVLRVRPWCRPQLFHVQDTLDLTLHLFGLAFFLEILFRVSK